MRYTEETLSGWCDPASINEEQKINNSINMIKDAIAKSVELSKLDIEIFVQGSYANNTNVRNSSDVDVCIMLRSTFFTEYPDGFSQEHFGHTDGTISFAEYKKLVIKALTNKFGIENVAVGNKSIKISSNTYHVKADAVVAFMLKDYRIINSKKADVYVEGIRFWSKSNDMVTNYPKDHINNGVRKNNKTNYAYKKLVRIFKRLRNEMVEAGMIDGNIITSFLVECLIWNVPDSIITKYSTWNETVKQSILYIYDNIDRGDHAEWGEVSERLYLFRGRKWSAVDAMKFMNKAWGYLGYAE